MGKKFVHGNRKPDQRTFSPFARAVATAGVLAASVYAVNISAGSAEPVRLAGSVAGTGSNPGAAASGGTSSKGNLDEAQREPAPPASDQVGAAALPPAILSDPQVSLAFPRTPVGSVTQDSTSALTVGAARMGRPGAGFLMAPLQLLDPSSPFGFRVSPLSGTAGDFHLGQDYAAACGTPVHAADSGVVRAAGWHPWGGGNRVEIDHGDGLITTYNHLESIGVQTGDKVQVGQVIARVGTTGWSTGCHLHFEAILNGRYTNPMRWSFLQLHELRQGLPAGMVSYSPGKELSGGRVSWTIPLKVDPGGGFPAGLQASPFPPLLPAPPAPGPAEATGIVLPPPNVELTTTTPPPAEPLGSAAPPSPSPAPSDPAPSPTDGATPAGTATSTSSQTDTATSTDSATSTSSPTDTATSTSADTATSTPTSSPAGTATPADTATSTSTSSPTEPTSSISPTVTGPSPSQPSTTVQPSTAPVPSAPDPAPSEPPQSEPLPSIPLATTPAPPPTTPEPAPAPAPPAVPRAPDPIRPPAEPLPTPGEPTPTPTPSEPTPTPSEPAPTTPPA